MWTTGNRCRYDRSHLRYESDLTDEERAEIEPQIPPAKRGGNRRTVNIREVVNGLMYILSTERIHHALYVKCREQNGRQPSPTAAVIDSQSVKSAEKGALDRSARV